MSQLQLEGQNNFQSKNRAETDRAMLLSRAPQLRLSTAWTYSCCSSSGLAHEQTSKIFPSPRPSPIHRGHGSGWKGTGTKGLNTAWTQRTMCVQVSCNETTQLCSTSGDNTSLLGIVQIQPVITHYLLGNYSSDTTAQIFTSCKLLLNSSANSSWDFRLNSFSLSCCANLRPALLLKCVA